MLTTIPHVGSSSKEIESPEFISQELKLMLSPETYHSLASKSVSIDRFTSCSAEIPIGYIARSKTMHKERICMVLTLPMC